MPIVDMFPDFWMMLRRGACEYELKINVELYSLSPSAYFFFYCPQADVHGRKG